MQVWIDTFDVIQVDRFVEQHFVERHCKPTVDVMSVENGQSDDPADEVKVGKVVGINSGVWIDLERVDVLAGVEEQSVVRVEHLVTQ